MKWKVWKAGLLVAVVTGFATGFLAVGVFHGITLLQFAEVVGGSICKDLLLYLAKHPVDQVSFDTQTITKESVGQTSETKTENK